MCDRKIDDMSTDEILEFLVRTQRDKIEKILKAQKDSVKEKMGPQKEKIEDALKAGTSLFFNPEIQRHFVKAGMEFLAGMEELIRNIPMPDFMKETMHKASESKDIIVKDIANEKDAEKKQKTEDSKMKKIDVE
ncbi:MAG: hypothetical protein LBV13_05190 [Methanomassiliicoccaceae archaeon]|jgi:hypothetical protein|nr:hypothetical protein [Methanomassiliicoccaceae archaeon]